MIRIPIHLRYYEDDIEGARKSKLNLTVQAQIFVDEVEFNLKKETTVFNSVSPTT
jgi:hypothetical protein